MGPSKLGGGRSIVGAGAGGSVGPLCSCEGGGSWDLSAVVVTKFSAGEVV
jgi:hypothetical protein